MKKVKQKLSMLITMLLCATMVAQSVSAATLDASTEGSAASYQVSLDAADHGSVSFVQDGKVSDDCMCSYQEGAEVVLNVAPDGGYQEAKVEISTAEGSVDYEDRGENMISFLMPAADVSVHVDFKEESELIEVENTGISLYSDIYNNGLLEYFGGHLVISTTGIKIKYGTNYTNVFNARNTDIGMDFLATCLEPKKKVPSSVEGTYRRYLGNVNSGDERLLAVMAIEYLCAVPEFNGHKSILYERYGDQMYAGVASHYQYGKDATYGYYGYSHAAMGATYSYLETRGFNSDNIQGITMDEMWSIFNYAQKLFDQKDVQEVLDCTWIYLLKTKRDQNQDLMVLTTNPGILQLTKKSANPSVSDGNDCYSIAGAVYGIYSDATCTSMVGTLTTDASGNTEEAIVAEGNYYVKEISAPKGYALDETVYPVRVNAGTQVTYLNLTDKPQLDPIKILLEKVDKDSNTGQAQGKASLENAEFEVKFYAGSEYTSGKNVTRSWIVKTDADGYCELSEGYKVSGDDFWYLSNGDVGLPLGTVTVQEVKAPEGYCLNDEVFVRQISSDSKGEGVYTYNAPVVPDRVMKGDVQIIKFAEQDIDDPVDPVGLQGAEFTFTSKTTGAVVTKIVTDAQGFASTHVDGSTEGTLPYDDYVVTETKVPDGYAPVDPFEVTINSDEQIIKGIYLEDKLLRSPISIVKKDATTGKIIPVSGAEFRILDEDGNAISVKNETTFTTDKNGQIMFPKALKLGNYYLEEVNAPYGYLKGAVLQFSIENPGSWEHPLVISYYDQPEMGCIRISKMDEETGTELADAVFEVSAAEDIVTPDGTVRVPKGTVVDELTTNEKGTAQSKELYLGKYTVKEKKAPDGYICSEEVYEVELKYCDQDTSLVYGNLEVKDKPNHFKLVKSRKEDDQLLEGVTFKIWNEDCSVSETVKTDETGEIHVKRLPEGDYSVQEIETVPGYVLDDTIQTFSVDENGQINGLDLYELKLENDYTKVQISKTDITTGKELPGAKLEIRDKDGNVIESWTSTEEPHLIDTVPAGEYVLHEEIAPDGYVTASDVTFTVEATGEVQKVEMQDDITKVQISKTDITTGKELAGAKLEIRDKDGKTVEYWISTDEPHYMEKLPVGKYVLHEESAPDGYEIAEDVEFTVADTGEIQKVEMKDQKIGKIITKMPENFQSGKSTAPKTGDSFPTATVLICIAAGAVLTVMIIKKRKTTEHRQV